jgi:phosphate/sulfate permease
MASNQGRGKGGGNPLSDIQNILGFLVAGFAGALGILGLRSAEVSVVLRNKDTEARASFVVIILFIAVLAAVCGVVVSRDRPLPWSWVAAIAFSVLGIGSLLIYATPVNQTPNIYSTISFWVGIGLFSVAAVIILSVAGWALIKRFRRKPRVPSRWPRVPSRRPRVNVQAMCILASVALLAISIYGAMRLEAYSQGHASIQISASVAKKSGKVTLDTHVAASKLTNDSRVSVTVEGLSKGVHVAAWCRNHEEEKFYVTCVEQPCRYLRHRCHLIFGAFLPPDANGALSYTLKDRVVPHRYQDVWVKAQAEETDGNGIRHTNTESFLDIHLSKSPRLCIYDKAKHRCQKPEPSPAA